MHVLNRPISRLAVLSLFTSFFIATSVQAQETGSGGEDFAPNSIEVFFGATLHDSDSEASFGLAYERRVRKAWGIGGLVEYTNGREWVLVAPLTWHITDPWKVLVAVGLEREDHDNTFLTRVGTAYEFKFTGWSLAPEVNVDFVGGEVKTVLGVSVGWEF